MQSKRHRVQELLRERHIDGAILSSPENFHYATGAASHQHTVSRQPTMASVVLSTRAEEEPFVVCMDFEHPTMLEKLEGIRAVPYSSWVGVREYGEIVSRAERLDRDTTFVTFFDALARCVRDIGVSDGTIGIELDFVPEPFFRKLVDLFPKARFVDVSPLLILARSVKTAEEIVTFRTLTEVMDRALLRASEAVRVGATERDVAQVFRENVMASGVCAPSSWSMFTTGANASMLRAGGERRIADGDVFKFDGGVNAEFDFYTTDTSRSWIVGDADPELVALKDRLCEAQRRMIAAAVPGMPISELFRTGFDHVRAEYDCYRRGHLGHSISMGPQTAEAPFITATETRPLEPGMILCVEVPCYIEGTAGFNIEDMILITDTGCEVLTHRTPHYL